MPNLPKKKQGFRNLFKSSNTNDSFVAQKRVFPILQKKKELLLQDLFNLRNEIKKAVAEREEEKQENTKKEFESINLGELNKEILKTKEQKRLFDNRVDEQEALFNILKYEVDDLRIRIGDQKKESKVLENTNEKLKVSISQNVKEEKRIPATKAFIEELISDEKQVIENILELKTEENVLNKENKKLVKKNDDMRVGLEDREGAISKNEVRLAKADKRLKTLKQELEKYYNRKFPYIIV